MAVVALGLDTEDNVTDPGIHWVLLTTNLLQLAGEYIRHVFCVKRFLSLTSMLRKPQ